jgi:hypothetical protein
MDARCLLRHIPRFSHGVGVEDPLRLPRRSERVRCIMHRRVRHSADESRYDLLDTINQSLIMKFQAQTSVSPSEGSSQLTTVHQYGLSRTRWIKRGVGVAVSSPSQQRLKINCLFRYFIDYYIHQTESSA